MALEADEAGTPKKNAFPKDLSTYAVTELQHYIASLEAEIARARAMIDAKQAHKTAAESLFRR